MMESRAGVREVESERARELGHLYGDARFSSNSNPNRLELGHLSRDVRFSKERKALSTDEELPENQEETRERKSY